MAPVLRKKPPKLSTQSHSLDSDTGHHPDSLVRTISDCQLGGGQGRCQAPDWLKRSKDKLGETPKYLIRTGSMKSRDIKEEYEAGDRQSLTLPASNYASYVLQAGCFMWTGRAYYKDSYIVQRREGTTVAREKYSTVEPKTTDNGETLQKCYVKPSLPEKKKSSTQDSSIKEKKDLIYNKLVEEKSLQTKDTPEHIFKEKCSSIKSETEFKRADESLNDDIRMINRGQMKQSEKQSGGTIKCCKEIRSSRKEYTKKDKIKDGKYSENTKRSAENKVDTFEGLKGEKESERDRYCESDYEQRYEVAVENCDLFTLEKKVNILDNLKHEVESESDKYSESDHSYDKYRPEVLYENCGPFMQENTLPTLERIQPMTSKKTPAELLDRMRDKIRDLVEKQFEVDYSIVVNEMIAKDIATKLSYFANEREVEKFSLHVEEFDSVHCLILGLAGRLAKAEQNILESDQATEQLVAAERKREKLAAQLSEAQWIKDNIDRRARKVCRSIERYLGDEDLEKFKLFMIEKEKLISDSKELSDKMRLSKKQLIELELGERWGKLY
eukprot:GFUD01010220.1.p1 GENE.GFUD01010220.1~~GFUD01010220.1.p1  ORF type:complete len:571 (-),score=183.85 GFUD01010220.1:22-1686(-)